MQTSNSITATSCHKALPAILMILALTGCATIMGHNMTHMGISSVPPGAHVMIATLNGHQVYKGTTPAHVVLQKSTGHYWGGEAYKVKISLAGYKNQTILLVARPDGWYLWGNMFFGGPFGWFVVDPWNGAMYTLQPQGNSRFKYKKGTLGVVMIRDVPPALRKKMVKVGQLKPAS